uniref:Uncharacterized protein n=1 Tax=Arundo donax TaxID=35708 RepID=A0A0A9E2Y7_ARUDO
MSTKSEVAMLLLFFIKYGRPVLIATSISINTRGHVRNISRFKSDLLLSNSCNAIICPLLSGSTMISEMASLKYVIELSVIS